MSRIYIENLPKNTNENELRKRFCQKGEITDMQLKKEKRTAFVGFKTVDQAKEAVNYFDKTFINSCKISVKLAQGFRLKSKEPSNDESLLPNDETDQQKKFDPFEEFKDDLEFKNFLNVQRNIDLGKGKQIWKDDVAEVMRNDSIDGENLSAEENNEEEAIGELMKKSKTKDTFEFTVKLKGLPYKIKKRQLKDFLLPVKPLSLRFVPKVKGIAYISFKTEADLKQTLVKHRGFIDGHRIEITRYQLKSDELVSSVDPNKIEPTKKMAKWKNAEPASEPIGESGRIYVRNLSYTCTEENLKELFAKFGVLTELHMPIDSYTKKPKGFAFITFMFPEHAVQAFNELDKKDFQGRLLHLLPAHAKNETFSGPPAAVTEDKTDEDEQTVGKKSSFKKDKQEELKKEASNPVNWNTLFIRPDAVADIMSKKFEVNKLDLLTKGNKKDNVAVRIALGETQLVNEIKSFLVKNKVSLDSFSRGTDCPRSKTVILVKNLPAETTKDSLEELFSKFGLLNRVILPPYGVTAIIEMQEPAEAKFAFKKLAYTNFKHYPLYLEWAPADVFDTSPSNDNTEITNNLESKLNASDTFNEEEEELPEDNTTLFVKNLNFETTEDDFRKYFSKIGKVYSATIATKKSSEGLLSMGYGFIQYFKSKHAKECLKRMQNSELNGHKVEIKLSNRTTNKAIEGSSSVVKKGRELKQTGSKICVKNIPFEATVNDIQKIFSVHGQIKSVRLPKKLAGSSSFRGFGFVDFVSKEDAKRAFEVLSQSTHLYGRPLVLEWAKEDSNNSDQLMENVEVRQVGAKMARYFGNSHSGPTSKRLRKSDLVDELQRSSNGKVGQADDELTHD